MEKNKMDDEDFSADEGPVDAAEIEGKCKHYDCKKRKDGGLDAIENARYCKRHKCTEPSCIQKVVSVQRCRNHGGGKRCKSDGCDKCVISGLDYCRTHTTGKKCAKEDCEKLAQDEIFGFCLAHSGKRMAGKSGLTGVTGDQKRRICSFQGCSKYKRQGGLCVSHGAKIIYARCKVEACTKQRQSGTSGMCKAHYKDAPMATSISKKAFQDTTSVPDGGDLLKRVKAAAAVASGPIADDGMRKKSTRVDV